MNLPADQIVIGLFASFSAFITGFFSIYNNKINKKIKTVEKKSSENSFLTVENNILSQIVPVLERKDECLDKMAEILENMLKTQELQNIRLASVEAIAKQKCQAPELIQEFELFLEQVKRKEVQKDLIKSLKNNYENTDSTK